MIETYEITDPILASLVLTVALNSFLGIEVGNQVIMIYKIIDMTEDLNIQVITREDDTCKNGNRVYYFD